MITNPVGCFTGRWLSLAGLILGASIAVGPEALGQAVSPSGVRGQTFSPFTQTQSDLHDAGVVVPGWPQTATEAAQTDQPAAPFTEAAPKGPINPSGVIGAAAAKEVAPTPSDLIAAGVVGVR